MNWVGVWTRAVVAPAFRRVTPVWIGTGIVGAVVLGPTGIQPHDLTQLALGSAVGGVLGATWLLLFLPAARVLLRAEAGTYLRSLPHARAVPPAIVAIALVALQLPWAALWLAGEGARGLAMVAATSLVALVAAIPSRQPRATQLRRLAGAYVLALRRRAGDALVRGAGLAILAGLAGGLVDRNNDGAPVFAAGLVAIVLVPAVSGALLALLDGHRRTAWLAHALGLARVPALALCVTGVYGVAAVLAAAAAQLLVHDGELALLVLGSSLGTGLAATRALLWAERGEHDKAIASRAVVGTIVGAAVAVVWLGWLGALGAPAMIATGLVLAVAA